MDAARKNRRRVLRPWFTALVDGYRRSRRRSGLHAVVLSAELVSDVPMLRLRIVRDRLATLHIACLCLRLADAEGADLRARRATRDCAADCRDRVALSAADLMAEDAAEHTTDQRAGNADGAGALRHCFLFEPA